eukprot:760233-Hanusia_phi.AAC.1
MKFDRAHALIFCTSIVRHLSFSMIGVIAPLARIVFRHSSSSPAMFPSAQMHCSWILGSGESMSMIRSGAARIASLVCSSVPVAMLVMHHAASSMHSPHLPLITVLRLFRRALASSPPLSAASSQPLTISFTSSGEGATTGSDPGPSCSVFFLFDETICFLIADAASTLPAILFLLSSAPPPPPPPPPPAFFTLRRSSIPRCLDLNPPLGCQSGGPGARPGSHEPREAESLGPRLMRLPSDSGPGHHCDNGTPPRPGPAALPLGDGLPTRETAAE